MRNRRIVLAVPAILLMLAPADAGMNPNNLGFPSVQLFDNVYDNNAYSALCTKCHERNPSLTSATSADNTAWGSHFVFGGAAANTRNTNPEKLDAWPSGMLSKYGKIGDRVSVTGVAGEIVCESCHTMKVYTGSSRLLVADNTTTDPSPLCQGCHSLTGPGHHLLTGETSTIHNRPLTNEDSLMIRNPPTVGSGATYPGAGLNCRSCHKPHAAQTKTAARILHRGSKGGGSSPLGAPVQGVGTTGLERQDDIAGTPVNRLVTDFTALCDSCHKASDSQ